MRFFLTVLLCLAAQEFADAQTISSFPHSEDFESFSLCTNNCGDACILSSGWVNSTTDQTDWTTFSGATPTNPTGPDADHTLGTSSGKYLYVESSGACSSKTASLLSPPLDLTGLPNFSMDFWYHLYGNNLGTIHVDVSTDFGSNFNDDIIPPWTGNQNLWLKKTVNLDAYVGNTIIVRIRGMTGNGALSDIGIDDFSFYVLQGIDAGMVSIDAPVRPLVAGVHNVAVTIKNFGIAALTNVSIGWSVDGMVQPSYFWTGNLLTGEASSSLTIGSYNFLAGTHTLKAWTYNPNGTADDDSSNDTLELALCTALNGTYTIGGAAADFTDFLDAVTALNICGVNGAVMFNVSPGSGPYVQQITIPRISGASAANTITFNGNGEMIQINASSSDRHVIKLDGAKHVTLTNLHIKGLDPSYTWGVHLLNNADSITIRNCTIDVSANSSALASNSGGIIASASTTAVNTAGSNASNLTIENNTIIGGFQGVRIHGQSSNSKNNRITGNTIRDFYSYGIYLSDCDNTLVSGNDISRASRQTVGIFYGINLDLRTLRTRVEKNRIHNTHDNAFSLSALSYGIAFNNADAPAGYENLAVNNVIYNFNSNGTVYGIYNNGSNGAHCYHNTISLDHSASAGGIARGFFQTVTATNLIFKNNIITVRRGGTGARHCIYLDGTGSAIISDYNVFFIDTSTGNVGYRTADYRTLAHWQTANANAYDAHSVFADPQYSNAAGGNLSPISPLVNNTGEGIGIIEDILGNARDAGTPDAGAYEFTPPAQDASLLWVAPAAPAAAGSKTITVNLANSILSQGAIAAASLSYTDGTAPVTQLFSGLNIPPGGSQNLSFSTPYMLNAFVTLKAYINTINGISEYIQSNDTARIDICPALAGSFTINKTAATSSTNFQSFNAAVDALKTCGISGGVTFEVVFNTGPYFEQVVIPEIPGAGPGSPVVFNGNRNTVNFNTSSANRYIFRLDGADYITLNDIDIIGTSISFGWGIHLYNQAEHNTINNCYIIFPFAASIIPDDFAGIVASGSTTSISDEGNNANYTVVTNCSIINAGYGIRINGAASTRLRGNRITYNTIQDFYSYGIYVTHADSTEVAGNDISRGERVHVGAFYGITLGPGCTNTFIRRNRIHNTHDAASDLSGVAYGIWFSDADASSGNENRAINNLLYDFNGNGIIYALYNSGSDHAVYYHNTVVLDNAAANTNDETRGFYQHTAAAGIDFRNNIVFLGRGGTGPKHCLYFATSGSGITSDYNVLVMNAPGGYVGHYSANDYPSLAAWKTANGNAYDQHSISDDPMFADAANDDFRPTGIAVNNKGTGLGVAEDIDGNIRNTSAPDPGAYEFIPQGMNLDAAIVWVAPRPPVTAGPQTVKVSISNLQTTTITQLVLSYTDGSSVVTQTFGNLNILSGNNQDFSFSTPYNFSASVYLWAYIESVNATMDNNRSNDTTARQLLCEPLSGSYTINAGAAASSRNFSSFNEAVAAVTSCGISAPVIFNVVAGSGPYNEQLVITAIPGASHVRTALFKGNGNELVFNASASARQGIMLNGARHITIDGLNITGANATYGYGIVFTNAADSNTISGCTIDLSAVTSTQNANSCGILFSGSAASTSAPGNTGSRNTITGNTIIGGYYGVRINGFVAVQNNIAGNAIRDFYAYGIYLQDAIGTEITANDISRAERVNVTTFNGIYLSSGNVNTRIRRNRIHNTHDTASDLGLAAYGINFSNCDAPPGQENRVINNAIYNLNNSGTAYGIYNSSSDGAHYYHNSISIEEAGVAGGSAAGFYQTTFASNIDFRNNIISVSRTGSGAKYCLVFAEPSANIISNYNIFYIPSDNVHFVGQFGITNYNTLPAWQSISGRTFDQNTLFAAPLFASVPTGNLTPLNASLDNKGTPLGIAEDIRNAPRSLTAPDIGAFEFTPAQVDATVITLLEPANLSCGTTMLNITAVVSNFGFDTVGNISVTAHITGDFTGTLNAMSDARLALGQTDTITLGGINFTSGGRLVITVVASAAGDLIHANDTAVFTRHIHPSATQPVLLAYDDTVCNGSSVTVGVIANPNFSFQWFDASAGGNLLHSGTTWVSPALDSSVTFYVEAAVGNCRSPRTAAPVYVDSNTAVAATYRYTVEGTGLDVSFDADDSRAGNVYLWDFGDAQSGTAGSITHQYGIDGSYTACLTVWNSCSQDSSCQTFTVCGPFHNDFSYTASGQTVDFEFDGTGLPLYCAWDFGDGSTSSDCAPTHNYLSAGNYAVQLIAENLCGESDTALQAVRICEAVHAGFTATVQGDGKTVVTANNSSGTNLTYGWDFGDGFTSQLSEPAHAYSASGTYTISLIVADPCGQSDTATRSVSITVGIAGMNAVFNFSIYPNPNDGVFVIEYNLIQPSKVRVWLMNVMGEVVYENISSNLAGRHLQKMSLAHLPKGVYMLQAGNDARTMTRKMIVQ